MMNLKRYLSLNEENVIYMPWSKLGRSNIYGHFQFKLLVQQADKVFLHGFWLNYPWLKKIKKNI